MLREMGYTNGVENYSRHMDVRKEGEPPFTCVISSQKISLS
jgi:Helicase subunit of the DNA excision repair complex